MTAWKIINFLSFGCRCVTYPFSMRTLFFQTWETNTKPKFEQKLRGTHFCVPNEGAGSREKIVIGCSFAHHYQHSPPIVFSTDLKSAFPKIMGTLGMTAPERRVLQRENGGKYPIPRDLWCIPLYMLATQKKNRKKKHVGETPTKKMVGGLPWKRPLWPSLQFGWLPSFHTPWKFNIAPENKPSQKERLIFQPSFFRSELLDFQERAVKLRERAVRLSGASC